MLGNIGQYKCCVFSTLNPEATHSSEMVVTTYQTTTCLDLKEHNLKLHSYENPKKQVFPKSGKIFRPQGDKSHQLIKPINENQHGSRKLQ
jgi:hypothetical protein